jgi:hypothetical protein
MAFTKLSTNQTTFLEGYLRGTNRELTAAQARSTFGIRNIRARMTELRQAGLNVKTRTNYDGRTAYSVTARDVFGSRGRVFG